MKCNYCKKESTHNYECKDKFLVVTCDQHKLKGYYTSLVHDGKKVTYMLRVKSSFPFINYVPFIETA